MTPLATKVIEQAFAALKGNQTGVIRMIAASVILIVTSLGTFTLADCKTTACKECVLKCLDKTNADEIKICVKHCLNDLEGNYDQILITPN
jgi:hypothetical protein